MGKKRKSKNTTGANASDFGICSREKGTEKKEKHTLVEWHEVASAACEPHVYVHLASCDKREEFGRDDALAFDTFLSETYEHECPQVPGFFRRCTCDACSVAYARSAIGERGSAGGGGQSDHSSSFFLIVFFMMITLCCAPFHLGNFPRPMQPLRTHRSKTSGPWEGESVKEHVTGLSRLQARPPRPTFCSIPSMSQCCFCYTLSWPSLGMEASEGAAQNGHA